MARWAQEAYRISERHAVRLVKLAIGTLRYQSRKVFEEVLRHRLRELAGTHVRYGYRRLTVLLRREGWHVNGPPTASPGRSRLAAQSVLEHGCCE